MQVGELLQLGRQVILGGRQLYWRCILLRGRGILGLLLRLGIGRTLLVGLVILRLLRSVLLVATSYSW